MLAPKLFFLQQKIQHSNVDKPLQYLGFSNVPHCVKKVTPV